VATGNRISVPPKNSLRGKTHSVVQLAYIMPAAGHKFLGFYRVCNQSEEIQIAWVAQNEHDLSQSDVHPSALW